VRIVGGRLKRRKLRTNPGLVTRPLTDRAKETLFDRLGTFDGERVADVFAGTGTIGLEALSRGAASVVFVERDRTAHELLRENVAALGVADETLCWRADALKCSFRPKGVDDLVPFDVVFCDPPYAMVADVRPGTPFFKTFERLARDDVTAPDAVLVLRTPADSEFELPAAWQPEQTFDVSAMTFHVLRRAPHVE
jgi:16S rRNA (guanine966-N2)-methyltransferase